jgi:rubrerythrin
VADILQPAEIVEIGIEKEKKRRDFYALAAERFKGTAELGELFARLRDWEVEHIRKFEEIRDGVKKAQYTESYPGETEAYMDALVDGDLYAKITPEKFGEIVKTPADALEKGIGFEKDAILFFGQLARFVDPASREVVDRLVKEEQQHMLYLFNMKKEITGRSQA